MKLTSFFNLLSLGMFAGGDKRPTRSMVEAQRNELMQRKDLRAEAKRLGDAKRLNDWKRSCETAYEQRVSEGRLGGLPRWWLVQRGHVQA